MLILRENIIAMISQNNSIAIFASGNGSNAIKLIECAQSNNKEIACLISDNPNANILKVKLDIPVHLIPYNHSKTKHEEEILKVLKQYDVNWIFLAGYMRILSANFIQRFTHKNKSQIINIHPSLLPKYQGLNAYERSYQNQDQYSGITIHYVDAGIDTGEIIIQGKFERTKADSLQDFIQKGLKLEHTLYPQILMRVFKYNY